MHGQYFCHLPGWFSFIPFDLLDRDGRTAGFFCQFRPGQVHGLAAALDPAAK